MFTQTATVADIREASIAALKALKASAFGECEAAWAAQSRITVDDGYTQAQALAAIAQAHAAEHVYRQTCTQLEAAYKALWAEDDAQYPDPLDEFLNAPAPKADEVDATPLGGW